MKKITKNELKKALRIAKNRRELHCQPSTDDRPFMVDKLYHEAIEKLIHEGYVEEGYYNTYPFQYNASKIITEVMILEKMNELLLQ
ncbi:MAG: hypothetical protein PHN19_06055 [Patescibacteria group bacterium]|nr:hypothetical protein [Patescibacteria group bacterium]